MEQALREEIKALLILNHDEWAKKKEQDVTTCRAEPLTFVEKEKLSNDDPQKRVKIIEEGQKVLECVVYAKECAVCKEALRQKQTVVREHDCPQNYAGSSKGMEASAVLLLTKKCFKIKIWAEKDARKDLFPEFAWPVTKEGKKKKSTGLLPLDIPEPGWLAGPTHQTKVGAKVFFDIKDKGKKYSNIVKADCL
eukprot:15357426-Ditylum_brightwellii.AAC.1